MDIYVVAHTMEAHNGVEACLYVLDRVGEGNQQYTLSGGIYMWTCCHKHGTATVVPADANERSTVISSLNVNKRIWKEPATICCIYVQWVNMTAP